MRPPTPIALPPDPLAAVRPPEYWPGCAYMALAAAADVFVLADTFRYSRQSRQNRARIRTPQGWMWLSVPLEAPRQGRAQREVRPCGAAPWARTHARALQFNYGRTPYYEHYREAVEAVLFARHESLAALNAATVATLCALGGLGARVVAASALPGAPGDLPGVLSALGARRLLAPPPQLALDGPHAGAAYPFAFAHPAYPQAFPGFEPGLSFLDLLFSYGPHARDLLRAGVTVGRP